MKKLFLLFISVLGFSITSNSQVELGNFKIDGTATLYWTKVFDCDSSINIINYFEKSGIIDTPTKTDSTISGRIFPIEADFKGAGYSEMTTPMYVARKTITAFVLIEVRPGRYKVTLRDITLTQKYADGLSAQGEITMLSTFAVKSSTKFKPAFTNAPAIIYNHTFKKRFNIILTPAEDSKW